MAAEPDALADRLASSVEVWRVPLDVGPGARSRLVTLLSEDERRRGARLRRAADRHRFEITRASLRVLLGRRVGVAPAALTLTAGAHGKPELDRRAHGVPPVAFNVTHSGSLALIAFTTAASVGVDVERLRPMPTGAGIARHAFSPAEAAFVAGGPDSSRSLRLLSCWTRKEAVLKADGRALGVRLDEVTAPLSRAVGLAWTPGGGPDECWVVAGFAPDRDHVAAVAIPAAAVGQSGATVPADGTRADA